MFLSLLYYTWAYNKVRELGIGGIIHYEFVPNGQTVHQVFYLEVLKGLREKVRRKQPEIFANKSWILHHNNATAHTALSMRGILAHHSVFCLTTGPKPSLKRFLHKVRSRASSFK